MHPDQVLKNHFMGILVEMIGKNEKYYRILEVQDQAGFFKEDSIPQEIIQLLSDEEIVVYKKYLHHRNKAYNDSVLSYFKSHMENKEPKHNPYDRIPTESDFKLYDRYRVSVWGDVQECVLWHVEIGCDKGQYYYMLTFDKFFAWFDIDLQSRDKSMRVLP